MLPPWYLLWGSIVLPGPILRAPPSTRAWPHGCTPAPDNVYCREHFSRRYPLELIIAGLLAFIAGVSFGIFGAGGSTLLVPILVYVLHLPVRVALCLAMLILVF